MKLTSIFPRIKDKLQINMGYQQDAQGNQSWYYHRKLHRDDGPAYIGVNGEKQWFKFGKKHRDGGLPAVEGALGGREWWVEDQRHRDGGPAVEMPDGTKEWWQQGKRHRADGPAIERPDGRNEWFLDGKEWPQGKKETPIIQKEQKEQALAEVAQAATVADDQITLLQPVKFKKPGPTP